jgi:hypothetical protein
LTEKEIIKILESENVGKYISRRFIDGTQSNKAAHNNTENPEE